MYDLLSWRNNSKAQANQSTDRLHEGFLYDVGVDVIAAGTAAAQV